MVFQEDHDYATGRSKTQHMFQITLILKHMFRPSVSDVDRGHLA